MKRGIIFFATISLITNLSTQGQEVKNEKWRINARKWNDNQIASLRKKAAFELSCNDSLKFTVLETDYDVNVASSKYRHYPEKNKAFDEVSAHSLGVEGCGRKLVYIYVSLQLGWVLNSATK